jgi:phosphate/sulfate permease
MTDLIKIIGSIFQKTAQIPYWVCVVVGLLLLVIGNYCGSATIIEKIKQKKIRLN